MRRGIAPASRLAIRPAKTLRHLVRFWDRFYTLEEFLECFSSVTKEAACQVLELSEAALLAA